MSQKITNPRTIQVTGGAIRAVTSDQVEASEKRLLARVRARWHEMISVASRYSSVPAEFLAALVANESAGNPRAARFEPAVYRHLKRVAAGKAPRYGSVTRELIEAEVADMLHQKSPAFHAAFLTDAFASARAPELAEVGDEALRELATSWGLTQIMGYHMAGREVCNFSRRLLVWWSRNV